MRRGATRWGARGARRATRGWWRRTELDEQPPRHLSELEGLSSGVQHAGRFKPLQLEREGREACPHDREADQAPPLDSALFG